MKLKRKLIIASIFIVSVFVAFFIGKSQTKTEIVTPSITDYIECDSFEEFFVNGNELHIIVNDGNEYVFSN